MTLVPELAGERSARVTVPRSRRARGARRGGASKRRLAIVLRDRRRRHHRRARHERVRLERRRRTAPRPSPPTTSTRCSTASRRSSRSRRRRSRSRSAARSRPSTSRSATRSPPDRPSRRSTPTTLDRHAAHQAGGARAGASSRCPRRSRARASRRLRWRRRDSGSGANGVGAIAGYTHIVLTGRTDPAARRRAAGRPHGPADRSTPRSPRHRRRSTTRPTVCAAAGPAPHRPVRRPRHRRPRRRRSPATTSPRARPRCTTCSPRRTAVSTAQHTLADRVDRARRPARPSGAASSTPRLRRPHDHSGGAQHDRRTPERRRSGEPTSSDRRLGNRRRRRGSGHRPRRRRRRPISRRTRRRSTRRPADGDGRASRRSPRRRSPARSRARSSRVNLTVGDSVSAASSTANIVVQGAGGYEVTTTVSVDAGRRRSRSGKHATVVARRLARDRSTARSRRSPSRRAGTHDDDELPRGHRPRHPNAKLEQRLHRDGDDRDRERQVRARGAHVRDHDHRHPPHRRRARRRHDQNGRRPGRCRRRARGPRSRAVSAGPAGRARRPLEAAPRFRDQLDVEHAQSVAAGSRSPAAGCSGRVPSSIPASSPTLRTQMSPNPLRLRPRGPVRLACVSVAGIVAAGLAAGPAVAATAAQIPGGAPFAGGKLVSRSGSTLDLQNANGETKVIVTSSTKYRETKVADSTAVIVGACVRVVGTGSTSKGMPRRRCRCPTVPRSAHRSTGSGAGAATSGTGPATAPPVRTRHPRVRLPRVRGRAGAPSQGPAAAAGASRPTSASSRARSRASRATPSS